MIMGKTIRLVKGAAVMMAMAALVGVSACETSGGGDDMESQFAAALQALNPDWALYEIVESRGAPTIKVDVSEIVDFQSAKKAVEAIQKVDPKFAGYIDFVDGKTGTVVRKMEVIPAQPAPAAGGEKQ